MRPYGTPGLVDRLTPGFVRLSGLHPGLLSCRPFRDAFPARAQDVAASIPGPSAAADEGPGAPQLDKIPRETGATRHTRVGKRLDCWENDCINRVGVHGDVYLAALYPLSKRTKGTKRLAGLSIRESVPRDQPRCPFGMDSDRFGN